MITAKERHMSDQRTVLVAGATGSQGGAAVDALLGRGHMVIALTRNPDSERARALFERGVTVAVGDFSDHDSLVRAARGADAAYAMTTPFETGTAAEIEQGLALVEAMKVAGIGHLVFGSVASADQGTDIPHFDSKHEVEKRLASLGVPYSIVAPVYFMDNLLAPWNRPALQEGKLTMAMPAERPLQQVAVSDIGAFAAALIERREAVFGKRYDIAGDELTGTEAAAVVAKASGREIRFEGFPPDALRSSSEDMALMFEWFDRVGYSADIEALRREFKEVAWLTFEAWASQQDWSALS
jgi:uncharacterized protein YbjT (DUF2867 family)